MWLNFIHVISDAHPIIRSLTWYIVAFLSKDSYHIFEEKKIRTIIFRFEKSVIINQRKIINQSSMDRKKTNATASSTAGKHGEKKDENFLSKTAHSIRDKVHELTDDVKEKTHHLTHNSDSKKNKKDKNQKKTGTTFKTSPNPRTVSRKDSISDSDDEDDSPKPVPSPSAPAGI